jgi:hypothetical protein
VDRSPLLPQTPTWTGQTALERLRKLLPGFRGYARREHRREADGLLRGFGAARIERAAQRIESAARGRDAALLNAAATRATEVARQLRGAHAAYPGFLDTQDWKADGPLEELYARDEELVTRVVALGVAADLEPCPLDAVDRELRDLARALERRRDTLRALA